MMEEQGADPVGLASPVAHLEMSTDAFGCTAWGCYWHLWIEAGDAAKHPIIPRQPPQLRIV